MKHFNWKKFWNELAHLIFLVIFIYASIYLFLVKIYPIDKQLADADIAFLRQDELDAYVLKNSKENNVKNTEKNESGSLIIDMDEENNNNDLTLKILEENINQGIVLVTNDKNDVLGEAVVLSNDGWLVLDSKIFNSNNKYFFDGELLKYEKSIEDPALNIVFVKVQADNLSVLKFVNDSQKALLADDYYILDNRERIIKVNLLDKNYFENEVFELKTLNKRFVFSSSINDVYLSSPILDKNANLVAIVSKVEANKILAIPVNYLNMHLASVYDNQWIDFDSVNIKYRDLAFAIERYHNLDRGALVLNKVKISDTDYLYKGDVILKVDNEDLNRQRSLNEVLQEYQKAGSVTLTVLRNNKRIELSLDLKYQK